MKWLKKKKRLILCALIKNVGVSHSNIVIYFHCQLWLTQILMFDFNWNYVFPFRYVVVYYSILYLRYHAGIVTDEMLSMPKAPFLLVGLLEALAAATGMAAGGNVLTSLFILFVRFLIFVLYTFKFSHFVFVSVNLHQQFFLEHQSQFCLRWEAFGDWFWLLKLVIHFFNGWAHQIIGSLLTLTQI